MFIIARTAGAATAGTLEMAASSYGAVQSIGVKITSVNRVGGSSGAVSVTCRAVGNTAIAGRDFTAVTHVLTWANGDATAKNCDIPIISQAPFNGSRSFYVEISKPTGATLGSPADSTVIIYGTEENSRVSLSSPTYAVGQSAGSLTVTVTRVGAADAASVAYATANSSALAGTNYTAEHGELKWAAGDMTARKIVIPISNAKPFSGTKVFAVAIASPSGTSMVTHSAVISIVGDAHVGTATLTWTAPTKLSTGAALSNLAGFHVLYGTSATALTRNVQITSPKTLEFEVENLGPGTWYFSVVAYTATGAVSSHSNLVSKTIPT